MAGDLVIEEGDLEALCDHTRDLPGRLQSAAVAAAGDYISPGVGGGEPVGQGCGTRDTADEVVIALARGLDDFPQFINDSINEHTATEDDTVVSSQQVRYNGPAMTMDDLLRMREEQ